MEVAVKVEGSADLRVSLLAGLQLLPLLGCSAHLEGAGREATLGGVEARGIDRSVDAQMIGQGGGG